MSASSLTPGLLRLLIVLAALVPLWPALANGFSFDDTVLIVDSNASLRERISDDFFGQDANGRAASGYWRPVTAVTYGLEKQLYGDAPRGYHATNLALHAGNSLLFYEVLSGIAACGPLAAGAALIFAAHPIHAESLAPATGRTDPLALLFVLLCALALRRGRFVLAAVAFLFALGSKESAIALLPFLALVPLASGRSKRTAFRVLLGGVVLGCAFFAFKIFGLGIVPPDGAFTGEGSTGQRFLTFVALVPRYLALLVWPADLSIAHPVKLVGSLLDPRFFSGVLTIVVLLALACARSLPLVLGSTLFLIPLLPASNVVPITYAFRWLPFPFFERYLYAPSLGFSLLASFVLWQIAQQLCAAAAGVARTRAVQLGLALLATIAFGWRMMERVPVFRNDETLFADAAHLSNSSLEPRIQAAVARFLAGDVRGAIGMFETLLRDSPEVGKSDSFVLEFSTVRGAWAQRLLDAGAALRARGDEPQSKQYLGEGYRTIDETRQALAELRVRDPRNGRALELLAVLSGMDGDPYASARQFREACELPGITSELPRNFNVVAQQILERGRAEGDRGSQGAPAAVELYKRGMEALCGEYPPTRIPSAVREIALKMWCDLADQLVLFGRAEEASATYLRILEHQPRLARCYEGLAYLTNAGGNVEATLAHLRKALEIDPEAYVALNLMVATLKREGRHQEAEPYYQRLLGVIRKGGNAPTKGATGK